MPCPFCQLVRELGVESVTELWDEVEDFLVRFFTLYIKTR